MNQFVETDTFVDWFSCLHDAQAKARINARLRRAELGNFGDCEPVGKGVSECEFTTVLVIECTSYIGDTKYSFCWWAAINPLNREILKLHCNWRGN